MSGEPSIGPTAPQWMLNALQQVPQDRAIGLLMRHADREALLKDFAQSYVQPLTELGRQRSQNFGKVLGNRLVRCHSSPLTRCLQTVQSIQAGAGLEVDVVENCLLGDPGVFVLDAEMAGQTWSTVPVAQINQHLSKKGVEPLPGMASGFEASMFAIQHLLSQMEEVAGIHVFCSHDSIVGPICSHLMGEVLSVAEWPSFLEGVFFWRDGSEVWFGFRDCVGIIDGLTKK